MPKVVQFRVGRVSASRKSATGDVPEQLTFFDAAPQQRAARQAAPEIVEPEFIRRLEENAAGTVRDMVGSRDVTLPSANSMARPATERELRRTIDRLSRELASALSGQHQALETARARKDVLISTSHELRTPLNAILGFSEILKTEMFGPLGHERYREYAGIIHSSGSHLLTLINDLLDLSKLDAGKLELHVERVEIFRIILDCVRQVQTQANKAHIGISVQVHDGVNQLLGDDKRLHQMLLNLLSNALKFTPEQGEINVDVFRRNDSIGISVSDTGIGIRPEDIALVLEPFGQVDGEMARKHHGTGLGLPLTKELAELHGGSLTMESALDAGTTITILLPDQLVPAP